MTALFIFAPAMLCDRHLLQLAQVMVVVLVMVMVMVMVMVVMTQTLALLPHNMNPFRPPRRR